MAEPMEQSTNSTAASSIIFLRPKRSANVPAIAEPIRQPTNAELTIQPSISSDNWNCFATGPGPGDYGRVEAEQQAAQRRHQQAKERYRRLPRSLFMGHRS